MKHKILRHISVLMVLFLSFHSYEVFATHAMGGDITYKCIAPNKYELSLKFFRDCNGIAAPTSGSSLTYFVRSPICGAGAGQVIKVGVFQYYPDSTEIITPSCLFEAELCETGMGVFGIERHLYKSILDLSAYPSCGDQWLVEWDYCCRNNAITSLVNPGAEQIYLFCKIDNTLSSVQCNNSPVFLNDPVPFGCVGSDQVYNHGVNDPDGDSLVFSLAPVRGQFGNLLAYESGFSVTQPLLTTSGVSIDSELGTLTFTPSAQQVAVVSVLVEEYRDHVKIGETLRDIQFTILNCNNTFPTVTGYDSTDTYSVEICEGTSFCWDFFSDDADGDSVFLSWNAAIPGATFTTTNGQDIEPTAQLCWTPTVDDIGTHLFSISARDNYCPINGSGQYGFKVKVRSADYCINHPPIITDTNLVFTLPEDSFITVCLDVLDPDTLDMGNITSLSNPNNGTIVQDSALCITYTPDTNFNGIDTVEVIVCDMGTPALCDTAIIIFIVIPVNDKPIANNDSGIVNSDSTLIIDVIPNDFDVDGDTLVPLIITQPNNGTVTVTSDNTILYDPNLYFCGNDTFTYAAFDGSLSDTAYVFIEVFCVNHPPVVVDTTGNPTDTLVFTIPEDSVIQICIDVVDPDTGDVVSIDSITIPNNGTITLDSALCFTYIPDSNFNGTDTVIVIICDNGVPVLCDTVVVIIIVTPVNDAPVAVDDNVIVPNDSFVNINVLINDYDVDDDSLSISIITNPLHGTISITGDSTILYTPVITYCGPDSFMYSICDPEGLCDTASVFVLVSCGNNPPVVVDTSGNPTDTLIFTIPEDSLIQICIDVIDPDSGDIVSIDSITTPLNGTITIDSALCFTYVPDSNFNGTDTIIVIVCDDGIPVLCDTVVVIIIVTPVNDAPIAVDDYANVPGDSLININVLNNDIDIDGDSLTISIVTIPSNGTATISGDSTILYTPAIGYCGPDSFQYEICDNGNPELCDTANVYVNVVCGNRPPEITDSMGVLIFTIPEDSLIQVCLDVTDPDNDSVSITNISIPGNGTVTLDSALCFTYTPDSNFNGVDSFTVIVCDDGTPVLCDTVLVIIIVTPVNDPPVAVDDNVTVTEDSSIVINVVNNDYDIDDDTLFVQDILTPPVNGTATIDPLTNTIVYVPAANFCGLDSFVYIVVDSSGATDTATVYIEVICENDQIIAIDDNASTVTNVPVDISILSNDIDVDGTPDPGSIVILSGPDNGTVSVNTTTGIVTYTPDSGFFGIDSFYYLVCDDGFPLPVTCDSALVIISVISGNQPPIAVNDSIITYEDSVTVINVLGNDTDPNNNIDPTSVSILDGTFNGTISVDPLTGLITYTPNLNFYGVDSFVYVICDLDGLCDTAIVIIIVLPVNDPPIAVDDYITIDMNEQITLDPSINDSDIDGDLDVDNIVIISGPLHGVLVNNGDGTFGYTPDLNYFGFDTIVYVICDNGFPLPALCDTATIIIEILMGDCDPPEGFSPDGDGINDAFIIPCLQIYPNTELTIYNRWGDVVWASNGPYKNDWTGTNENGKNIPDGTYFYILDFKDANRENIGSYLMIYR